MNLLLIPLNALWLAFTLLELIALSRKRPDAADL